MEVQDLAPALLALADIIQIANRKFNGDSASMRVLVNADVEQKCFQIDISLIQTLLDQARVFFAREDVATAKEIAEWVGMIGGAGGGLFAAVRMLYARKETSTQLQVVQPTGSTVVQLVGDGNTVSIPAPVYELVREPAVVEKVKTVLKPLERQGYETLAFVERDEPVQTFTKDEALAILGATPISFDAPFVENVSTITGTVRIKTPQYEGSAKWSLLWNGRTVEAAMPPEWVAAFQNNQVSAPPNSHLQVRMTETASLDENGAIVGKPSYLVEEVLRVIPPGKQLGMFDDREL